MRGFPESRVDALSQGVPWADIPDVQEDVNSGTEEVAPKLFGKLSVLSGMGDEYLQEICQDRPPYRHLGIRAGKWLQTIEVEDKRSN